MYGSHESETPINAQKMYQTALIIGQIIVEDNRIKAMNINNLVFVVETIFFRMLSFGSDQSGENPAV